MRVFTNTLVAAFLSAAILAACGGGNTGLPSSWAMSEAQPLSAGKEKVVYSFGNGSGDGTLPGGNLINVNGTLYGTTFYGGADSAGTVFKITTSGTEKLLYSFKGGPNDGAYPAAGLINVNGTLYGTTSLGGASTCIGYGCGTVFAITTSGKEAVLYSFKGSKALPTTALSRMRASSTSMLRSTARPAPAAMADVNTADTTVAERSSRSRLPARRPCSTVSKATLTTADSLMRA
jgi:uncharacterized repeat protein (TIGR03803 family)